MSGFKVGDIIHKIVANEILFEKRYIILSIREKKGGDWHDGYTTEFIALVKEVFEFKETNETEEIIVEEEYLLRYTNYMCQHDIVFAQHLKDLFIL